jgi:hypothetical protein
MREFLRLQWLQKAQVPSPRAVAMLSGFRIEGRLGDALIMEAIEPGMPLDRYLNDAQIDGRRVREHRDWRSRWSSSSPGWAGPSSGMTTCTWGTSC